MSKKEVLCNLTESDMTNLTTVIECINVKDVIENNPARIEEIKSDLINLSVNEILSKYAMIDCADEGTVNIDTDTNDTDTNDTDTKVNKKEIIDNILYTLSIYDISKEDLQTINKLLACL